jgi:hypothetical protein
LDGDAIDKTDNGAEGVVWEGGGGADEDGAGGEVNAVAGAVLGGEHGEHFFDGDEGTLALGRGEAGLFVGELGDLDALLQASEALGLFSLSSWVTSLLDAAAAAAGAVGLLDLPEGMMFSGILQRKRGKLQQRGRESMSKEMERGRERDRERGILKATEQQQLSSSSSSIRSSNSSSSSIAQLQL